MSESAKCPQCGAGIEPNTVNCKYCGEPLSQQQIAQPQAAYNQQQQTGGINPNWPIKDKTTAGLLAILLGDFGIHKFYLGKTGLGILYLLLSWSLIPAVIGVIEGISYLSSDDYNFQVKHKVRLS